MSDVERALEAVAPGPLIEDLAALVRIPSVTGAERPAMEHLAGRARDLGLTAVLREYDLAALRADPGHPGEEAPRDELVGVIAGIAGPHAGTGPRLALCGHVDVVATGTVPWAHGNPFSGAIADGAVWGRGSVDMKAGVVAALHALAAVLAAGVPLACRPELLAVASEEDGGLGAFASLQDDDDYDACLITEPTGFDVVCAQAGAITFRGVVRGAAAHAAHRLEGVSAVDRYVPIHLALQALEDRLNAGVAEPLLAALPLPYPVNVGRVTAGDWPSSVPDRLEFHGRAPVRVGESAEVARQAVREAIDGACDDVELTWEGGQFASGRTPTDHPLAALVAGAATETTGRPAGFTGVPWGADMRLFTERGIPTVMCGTPGIERSHAVDERVVIEDVLTLTRLLVRVLCAYGR